MRHPRENLCNFQVLGMLYTMKERKIHCWSSSCTSTSKAAMTKLTIPKAIEEYMIHVQSPLVGPKQKIIWITNHKLRIPYHTLPRTDLCLSLLSFCPSLSPNLNFPLLSDLPLYISFQSCILGNKAKNPRKETLIISAIYSTIYTYICTQISVYISC